jgi:hypothetical protein
LGKPWECIKEAEAFIERNAFYTGTVFGIHGEPGYTELKCERDYLLAYNNCSPLKSIIGKRAKAFNSGIKQIINPNTGKEVKSGDADKYRKLLKKPNPIQTESQFDAQLNIYVDIFGYCPVLKVRPAGLEGTMMEDEITALWNIPPWLFDIEYTRKWILQNKLSGMYEAYYMNWEGERIEIPFKDLFFVFDDGIGTENDTNLTIPDSRLRSNDFAVWNIIAAQKARNTLITRKGPTGILSSESQDGDGGSVPLRPGEKDDIQKDFKKYGIVGQSYQVIITDAAVKWQQMGSPTKDLLLFEEVEDDIFRLCDSYGVPHVLMATSKSTTYENQNQGRKDFIENTIVPESASRMEQFTIGLLGEESKLSIIRDYSKLSVMQEDKEKAAVARKTLDEACEIEYLKGLITKNDWREKLGMERITDDPTFDEYFDAAKDAELNHQRAIEVAQAKSKAKMPAAA